MGKRAGNLSMGRLVRVDPLDDSLWDWGAPGCDRSVAHADPRGTAAALAIWNDLDLVWHGVLCAHVVGCSPGYLAVGGLVVYTLDSGDGNWGCRLGPALLEALVQPLLLYSALGRI